MINEQKRCQKSWRINAMKIFSRIERQLLGKGGIHSGMSGKLECKRKRVFSTCANKGNVFIFYVQRIEFLRLVKATVVVVLCVGSFLTSDHIPVYH